MGRRIVRQAGLSVLYGWLVTNAYCGCQDYGRVEWSTDSLFISLMRHRWTRVHTLPTIPCKPIVTDNKPKATKPGAESHDGRSRLLCISARLPQYDTLKTYMDI